MPPDLIFMNILKMYLKVNYGEVNNENILYIASITSNPRNLPKKKKKKSKYANIACIALVEIWL
jgi:hypothetical protein